MWFVEFFEFGDLGGVEFEVEGGDGVVEVLLFAGTDDGAGDGFV